MRKAWRRAVRPFDIVQDQLDLQGDRSLVGRLEGQAALGDDRVRDLDAVVGKGEGLGLGNRTVSRPNRHRQGSRDGRDAKAVADFLAVVEVRCKIYREQALVVYLQETGALIGQVPNGRPVVGNRNADLEIGAGNLGGIYLAARQRSSP